MSASLSLPQHLSFQDLSRELQRTFRTAGGWRSVEDAMKLYKQVPASYRTSIDKVAEWMKGRDGSHIIPKSAGGSDKSFNIVLEKHLDNIRRGAKPMTRAEQFGVWVEGFSANLGQAALQGLQAAPIGAAIAVVTRLPITFIHYSCAVARGQMTKEEAIKASGKDLLKAGALGAISTAAVVMICAACPPIAAALALASPVLLTVGGAALLKEYYSVIAENKDILCKWLPKKTKELQAVEETIQQARALEAKEKFGLSFWLQWTGITTVAGFFSLLGTTSILGDLGSSAVGLYSLLSMVLSIGFAQWMLMRVRTGSGIQSLLIKLLVVAVSVVISTVLLPINLWLSLVAFFGLTGIPTFLSAKQWSKPLPLIATV
ncbi:MAG TPA: hypothetical protein V6C84_30170 [Coleofasciculaceae cyanobacterium]|jgi:hypothetical protein